MKTKSILPLAAATFAALALAACGGNDSAGEGTDNTASGGTGGYPLTTCVVSGEELGSMGDPVVVSHEGTSVKLCCDSCIEKFDADPAKYAAMVK